MFLYHSISLSMLSTLRKHLSNLTICQWLVALCSAWLYPVALSATARALVWQITTSPGHTHVRPSIAVEFFASPSIICHSPIYPTLSDRCLTDSCMGHVVMPAALTRRSLVSEQHPDCTLLFSSRVKQSSPVGGMQPRNKFTPTRLTPLDLHERYCDANAVPVLIDDFSL